MNIEPTLFFIALGAVVTLAITNLITLGRMNRPNKKTVWDVEPMRNPLTHTTQYAGFLAKHLWRILS